MTDKATPLPLATARTRAERPAPAAAPPQGAHPAAPGAAPLPRLPRVASSA
jgi:hypothetical protein